MSNNKRLIKNIEVFEKLAVYSDSMSFLRKISQQTDAGAPIEYLNRIEAGGRSALALLLQIKSATNSVVASRAINQLHPLLTGQTNSLTQDASHQLMTVLLSVEKQLATDPTTMPYVRRFSDIVVQMQQYYKINNYTASETRVGPPEQTVNVHDLPNAPAVKPKHKTMVPEGLQAALNYLGYPDPLQPDNILGQQTANALDWFKDTYKYPSTGPALYGAVMSEYKKKRLNPTTPDLADAARQQEMNARNPRT